MKKILYNGCHGGFGFSKKLLEELGYDNPTRDDINKFSEDKRNRTKKDVIAAVEKIGLKDSSGGFCRLEILELYDSAIYSIDDYDGKETLIYKGSLEDRDIIF